uniref:p56 n=1 Tax=Fig leaf mottle-associated virus 2 TaxID=394187 RepID=D0QET7_9CLOS|nr:p56 [Fig leaf mottle-associated virus 2]
MTQMITITNSVELERFLQCMFCKQDVTNEVTSMLGYYETLHDSAKAIKYYESSLCVASLEPRTKNTANLVGGFRWYEVIAYDFLLIHGKARQFQGTRIAFLYHCSKVVDANYKNLITRGFKNYSDYRPSLNNVDSSVVETHASTVAKGDKILSKLVVSCCYSSGRLISLTDIERAIDLTTKIPAKKVVSGVTKSPISRKCIKAAELYAEYCVVVGDVSMQGKLRVNDTYIKSLKILLFKKYVKPSNFEGVTMVLFNLLEKFKPRILSYDDRVTWMLTVGENAVSELSMLYGRLRVPELQSIINHLPYLPTDTLSFQESRLSALLLMSGVTLNEKEFLLFLPRGVFDRILTTLLSVTRLKTHPIMNAKQMLITLILYCIRQRTNKYRIVERQKKFTITFGSTVYSVDLTDLLQLDEELSKTHKNALRRFVGSFSNLAYQICGKTELTKTHHLEGYVRRTKSLNFDFVKYIDTRPLSEKERTYIYKLNQRFSKT